MQVYRFSRKLIICRELLLVERLEMRETIHQPASMMSSCSHSKVDGRASAHAVWGTEGPGRRLPPPPRPPPHTYLYSVGKDLVGILIRHITFVIQAYSDICTCITGLLRYTHCDSLVVTVCKIPGIHTVTAWSSQCV